MLCFAQSGDHVWLQRQHESRLMPAIMTATIATLLALCLAATPATWAHFGFLFSHSKAIHVMVIDLSLLTLLSPFLVVNDARARGVRLAQTPAGAVLLGALVLAVPLVGPGVYLLLRPVTTSQGLAARGRGFRGFREQHWRDFVPSWVSQFWPWARSVTPSGSQIRAAATSAKGRVARGGRQLKHNAAAAAAAARHAGSSAAAAGSNAAHQAANVVSAAHVPLPSERQMHGAADAAAYAAGNAAGRVRRGLGRVHVPVPSERQVHNIADTAAYAAGSAMGTISRGLGRVKRGVAWIFGDIYSNHGAAAAAEADDVFVDEGECQFVAQCIGLTG